MSANLQIDQVGLVEHVDSLLHTCQVCLELIDLVYENVEHFEAGELFELVLTSDLKLLDLLNLLLLLRIYLIHYSFDDLLKSLSYSLMSNIRLIFHLL